jgi:hypothetical protein
MKLKNSDPMWRLREEEEPRYEYELDDRLLSSSDDPPLDMTDTATTVRMAREVMRVRPKPTRTR